ncbi:MAG: FAD synthetase family protein, partial [Elusimicrobiaceae bacterium]
MKNFVTVGTMDGVHRGHAFIIGELARLARDARMKSLVLFFDYPPKAVLRGALFQSMITTPDERRALILKAGADKAECEHFTPELAVRSHEYFFSLLLSKYNMGGLLIGKDFAFGKDRMGHLDFLRAQCLAHGIPLVIDDFCREDGHKISSSVIRKLLSEGHVGAATRFLGRPYNLS